MIKKLLAITVIGFLLASGLGVHGSSKENTKYEVKNTVLSPSTAQIQETNKHYLNDEQRTGLRDIFFDLKISFLMKYACRPSLSACVIDDEVVWSNAYGLYDIENEKRATEHTIYNVMSISKTITGTALMQLYEQCLFDLDDDVNSYLPFSLRNPNFPDDPITFRMLLSHSSGLNRADSTILASVENYLWFNFSEDPPFQDYPYPYLMEHLVPGGKWYYSERWSSSYRPGEHSMYANVNFDLVAYLVELISGEIFVEYCKEHIFLPLEMYNTSFNLSELNIENVAIPYHYYDGEYLQINELPYYCERGITPPPDKYWRVHCYPACGLYTTVQDLSHFFIAHMNGGLYNGIRILKEETINEMHQVQPPGNDWRGYSFGLAWLFQEDAWFFDFTLSGHNGGAWGVSAIMWFIPSENIGVIYFSNGDGEGRIPAIQLLASFLILNSLFRKGGYNSLPHIDFKDLLGIEKI